MSLEWIADPVSGDAPCGDDLFENDDAEYSEYYFDAVGRLPEAEDYARRGMETGPGERLPDEIFDPNSVNLKAELAAIDGLLKRSRDVRLLTLRAQWCALAADPGGLVDSLTAMAVLLEAQVDTAHPSLDDGPRDRLDALNDLTLMGAMILPLRYLDLGDTGASLRRIKVTRGQFTAYDSEEDLIADQLLSALAKGGEEVEIVHGQITEMKALISRIETACLDSDKPHTPQLGTLTAELDGILEFLAEGNPDLAGDEDAAADGEAGEDGAAPAATGPGGETVFVKPATEVLDHDDARLRLVGVETYFGKHEPSSAAVLLVTQARLLIGKSLIEAFDALMPDAAPRSKVKFVSEMGFVISHASLTNLVNSMQVEDYPEEEAAAPEPAPMPEPEPEPEPMPEPVEEADAVTASDEEAGDSGPELDEDGEPKKRSLDEVLAMAEEEQKRKEAEEEAARAAAQAAEMAARAAMAEAEPDRPTFYRVTNQGEAAAQVMAVETYFRAVEKSSPVPILLARARSYIGKDFETLMREIVPVIEY
ncbi:MAG: type VI secretion system ImpA family N-terminal domain-containing protein [Pseudomonadota bacterium]